jgi:sulfoacetaldehyde dehydrogenase
MSNNKLQTVKALIDRANVAMSLIEDKTQLDMDRLVSYICYNGIQEENCKKLASLAYEETRLGDYTSKYNKLQGKLKGTLHDIKPQKTVGIISEDKANKIIKIAKPVGVIGALIPCTNPEITPYFKAMCALKGKNAIIFSPHPRSKKTTALATQMMRQVLKDNGFPEDLLICIEDVDSEISNILMQEVDLVIATGGQHMVKAAYSSGTPAYGVGAGNAVAVIDESADMIKTVTDLRKSQLNDLSSGCSSENSIIVKDSIYDEIKTMLLANGAYIVNDDDKVKLQAVMWQDGVLSKNVVAKPASYIASLAGIAAGQVFDFIVVEESGAGKNYPFSWEKLSPILTMYRYHSIDDAINLVNEIHHYSGAGHSCAIHSSNEDNVMRFAMETKTVRVMVNQSTGLSNSGAWHNGLTNTATLGCGTWGGNIISENLTAKHLINTTWVSRPFDNPIIPNDDELFNLIF